MWTDLMTLSTRLGREPLYDEPMTAAIKYKLTPVQKEELMEVARSRNTTLTGLIRDALEAYIESGVEIPAERLSVNLPKAQEERLEAVAYDMGFAEPTHFLQSMVIRVLNNPAAAQDFLFGSIRSESEARTVRAAHNTEVKKKAA